MVHVAKYTSPMDPMGIYISILTPSLIAQCASQTPLAITANVIFFVALEVQKKGPRNHNVQTTLPRDRNNSLKSVNKKRNKSQTKNSPKVLNGRVLIFCLSKIERV